MNVNVIKYSGEKEPFSQQKVFNSAKRAGASDKNAREITDLIKKDIYNDIETKQIFKKVKNLLNKYEKRAGLKFNLKEAIRKLGPTGFPFEKYIGEMFERMGYKVKINQIVKGKCSSYEIDFIAVKDNLVYVGECKYRNLVKGKVHSDTALANYARFLDISSKKKDIKSILVTNNKFTSKAIKYSKCVGVDLLGWSFPLNKGLRDIIEKKGLYPITILPSLNRYIESIFIQKKIMLVQDILDLGVEELFKKTKISKNKLRMLEREAKTIFNEV